MPETTMVSSEALDGYGATARQEHELVLQAGAQMLTHAIRAGEALLAAQASLFGGRLRGKGAGAWTRWVAENFPASYRTALTYMTLADQKVVVMESGEGTVKGAFRYVREALPDGGLRRFGADEAVRTEARRMRDAGMSCREVARLLNVSHGTVANWTDPRVRAKRRAEQKRLYAAHRARARDLEAKRAAREAGGDLERAFELATKLDQILGRAREQAADKERRIAITAAHADRDRMMANILRALGVS